MMYTCHWGDKLKLVETGQRNLTGQVQLVTTGSSMLNWAGYLLVSLLLELFTVYQYGGNVYGNTRDDDVFVVAVRMICNNNKIFLYHTFLSLH